MVWSSHFIFLLTFWVCFVILIWKFRWQSGVDRRLRSSYFFRESGRRWWSLSLPKEFAGSVADFDQNWPGMWHTITLSEADLCLRTGFMLHCSWICQIFWFQKWSLWVGCQGDFGYSPDQSTQIPLTEQTNKLSSRPSRNFGSIGAFYHPRTVTQSSTRKRNSKNLSGEFAF